MFPQFAKARLHIRIETLCHLIPRETSFDIPAHVNGGMRMPVATPRLSLSRPHTAWQLLFDRIQIRVPLVLKFPHFEAIRCSYSKRTNILFPRLPDEES